MQPLMEVVKEWLDKANGDLQLAELALNATPPVYWGAAFHAQQVAEKCLKGLLSLHGVEFEKRHEIEYLMDLLAPVLPQVEALRDTGPRLSQYAVDPRYPFPPRDPSESEAREAIEIARQVREFVRQRLPAELLK
ncbi:MAG: HEPN domain-containing protein [Planctomycetes bacterium]|nr:HEPN domain-containing protein [Planctomycetota bacterium]MBM4082845.1 HEPN domain-containing protein [Planctomycetota bacterium]MBM4087772.1 HEPN domain-containing protein [Planctomycetota bacterium]